MAKKKLHFCVLDTETATLPFADEIAENDPEKKKKIAIARPLIYDFGYCICDRQGNILDKKQFLVAETFCVPSIFNTAYYAEKRPIYLEMLAQGETTIKPWQEIMNIFLEDIKDVDAVGAYNSMFDFKKAIPFTELYINKLYSPDYYAWEKIQRSLCFNIANQPYEKNPEKEFEADSFSFRGETYPLFDLWGLATTHLLNNATYKKNCIEQELLTASGIYFKTSAESTYRYLMDKYDFEEKHTALDDAIIESFILARIAQKHAISIGIKFFPFRDLGYTTDFVMRLKKPNINEVETVIAAIENYVNDKEQTAYINGLLKRIAELNAYIGRE